jgi:hypothetical protein
MMLGCDTVVSTAICDHKSNHTISTDRQQDVICALQTSTLNSKYPQFPSSMPAAHAS